MPDSWQDVVDWLSDEPGVVGMWWCEKHAMLIECHVDCTEEMKPVYLVPFGDRETLRAVMPDDKETLRLAMNGFERIKTSDLTMDGYTTFHGRLSMDEVVAMNRLFEIIAQLTKDET